MNNSTKFKTGKKIKVIVSDNDEKGNPLYYHLIGMLTNAFPTPCDNAVAGLYISNYCDCPNRFLHDGTNLFEMDDIIGYVDELDELIIGEVL